MHVLDILVALWGRFHYSCCTINRAVVVHTNAWYTKGIPRVYHGTGHPGGSVVVLEYYLEVSPEFDSNRRGDILVLFAKIKKNRLLRARSVGLVGM